MERIKSNGVAIEPTFCNNEEDDLFECTLIIGNENLLKICAKSTRKLDAKRAAAAKLIKFLEIVSKLSNLDDILGIVKSINQDDIVSGI